MKYTSAAQFTVGTIFLSVRCVCFNIMNLIVSVYQCLDGSMSTYYCPYWEGFQGCDESNSGTYLVNNAYWTYGNWLYMKNHCQRSCKFCLENF
jgi:hypothetical protein